MGDGQDRNPDNTLPVSVACLWMEDVTCQLPAPATSSSFFTMDSNLRNSHGQNELSPIKSFIRATGMSRIQDQKEASKQKHSHINQQGNGHITQPSVIQ